MVLPLVSPQPVYAAGWLAGWDKRVKVTVDSGVVDAALTDFPFLVYISASSGKTNTDISCVFDEVGANSQKIAFTKSDGTTELYGEVEKWDLGNEKAWVWVKAAGASSIASGADTDFYLYYDNDHANNANIGLLADGSAATHGVWDSDFILVNHMGNDPDTGGAGDMKDSTSQNNDGTADAGMTAADLVSGQVGESIDFDGAGDRIEIAGDADWDDMSNAGTVESWCNVNSDGGAGAYYHMVARRDASTNLWSLAFQDSGAGNIAYFIGNTVPYMTGAKPVATNWYYYAARWDTAGSSYFYTDASQVDTDAGGVSGTGTIGICLGNRLGGGRDLDGILDEVRISKVQRSAAWLKATYYSSDDAFLTMGSEESLPVVTSCNATSVEETTATLCGNITSTGSEASCSLRGFVWDTSTHVDPGDTSPPATYSNNITQDAGGYGIGQYTIGVTGLTAGECYYYRSFVYNDIGYDYSDVEQKFQTKPFAPTGFSASTGAGDSIDLAWTIGTGSDTTYIRGKLGSAPLNRADGAYSWNGAGNSVNHAVGVADQHWYYIAWSGKTDCALAEQLSDTPDASANGWTTPQWSIENPRCTGFGSDWAVLTADIVTTGQTIVNVGFDYGITDAYGDNIEMTGTWYNGDTYAITLRGLAPATSYHFRGTGTDSVGGTDDSEDATFATTGSPAIYENYITGCDTASPFICSSNWTYQAFTAESPAHTVEYVRLYLSRVGNPSTVTCSIRHATDAVDEPTGLDLATATLNGDTFSTAYSWQQFEFDDPVSLEVGEAYAIVLSVPYGDTSNYVLWCFDGGGGLADAIAGNSTDGGSTWTADAGGADAMFEIWGYASLQVSDAEVFIDYLDPNGGGDWLIVADTTNTYPPYYNDNADPSEWFYLQLFDMNTSKIEAAVPCRSWGRQPLGIYMSADEVTDLTWGGNFTIRLSSLDGSVYQEYPLEAQDWRGDNMYYLDQWMRLTGLDFESYYEETFVVADADQGGALVLNEAGGVMFARGIPAITKVRPDMFSEVVFLTPHEEETWTHAYESGRDWSTHMGAELTVLVYDWVEVLGIEAADAQVLLGIVFVLVYMVLAIVVAGTALSGWAGIILAIPFLLAGSYMGIIDLTIIAVVSSFAFLMLLWNWVIGRA